MKRMILEAVVAIAMTIVLIIAFFGIIAFAQWLGSVIGVWFAFVVPIAAVIYLIYYLFSK